MNGKILLNHVRIKCTKNPNGVISISPGQALKRAAPGSDV